MKLSEAKSIFEQATGTASNINRYLLLAGIAIIWGFKCGEKNAGGISFSDTLITPLMAFVAGLISDIFHYLYQGLAWGIYYKWHHGKGVKDETVMSPPRLINGPTWFFFGFKILACLYGFHLLLRHINLALNQASGS